MRPQTRQYKQLTQGKRYQIQRRVSARKFSKADKRHITIIKKGLSLGWSPEKISGRMAMYGTKNIKTRSGKVFRGIQRYEMTPIQDSLYGLLSTHRRP